MTWQLVLAWLWAQPWHGRPEAPLPRRIDVAIAIAQVAAETDEPLRWAALLDTWAAYESAYRDVAGDCPGLRAGSPRCTAKLHAQSRTPYQTPSRLYTPSPRGQAELALHLLQRSSAACPAHPLSLYSMGRCAPLPASLRARAREAALMLRTRPSAP